MVEFSLNYFFYVREIYLFLKKKKNNCEIV